MEREAPFFQGLVHAEALWNDFGSQSFLKVPNAPLASLARCARPAGFHWGFAGVLLGFRWRSWIANLPNALQIFRKILGKSSSIPPKIHPKTFQNRPQKLKKSRSGGGCDLDCFLSLFVRRLGASWGRLGASWGRLGAVLGPLWGVLGASWGVLEPSWGVLEPSWASSGRLGASPRF